MLTYQSRRTQTHQPLEGTKGEQNEHGKELTAQKLLKAQRNIPISIRVILLKHIRHALERDAALDKQVEAHALVAALVVDAVHHPDERRGQVVPKRHERLAVFVVRDVARAVLVEAPE